MGVSAKVICDSSFGSTRLITMEIQLHRFILSEFNTHRAISRNFQSSRAVPVEKMIEQVKNDPALPVHWGKNQAGMVADQELKGVVKDQAALRWRWAANQAAECAEAMHIAGVHKQVTNRLLEPFMWTKGVATATYKDWQAFLKLRAHKDAQPEIQALAFKIRDAIEESETNWLKDGEWHLPYTDASDCIKLVDAIKISTSCVAQVSYRKLDDSLDKALKIYGMLNLPKDGVYPDDPPHFSPTEHIAMATTRVFCRDSALQDEYSGNFHSFDFVQYRKLLEFGEESGWIK